jgi:hypothetical protein
MYYEKNEFDVVICSCVIGLAQQGVAADKAGLVGIQYGDEDFEKPEGLVTLSSPDQNRGQDDGFGKHQAAAVRLWHISSLRKEQWSSAIPTVSAKVFNLFQCGVCVFGRPRASDRGVSVVGYRPMGML